MQAWSLTANTDGLLRSHLRQHVVGGAYKAKIVTRHVETSRVLLKMKQVPTL